MWQAVGGGFLVLLGGLSLVSHRFRPMGGPVPLGFRSSRAVSVGSRRAQRWVYLSFVLLGLSSIVGVAQSDPWPTVAGVLAIGWIGSFALFAVQVSFNWPKWWIPDECREEEGAVMHWFRTAAKRLRNLRRRGFPMVRNGGTTVPLNTERRPWGNEHSRRDGSVENEESVQPSKTHASLGESSTDSAVAHVTFSRPTAYADRLVSYKIWIDGEMVGKLRAGTSLTVPVPAGQHELRAAVQNSGSAPLLVSVAPAETLTISVQHPDPGGESTLRRAASRDRWLEMVVLER